MAPRQNPKLNRDRRLESDHFGVWFSRGGAVVLGEEHGFRRAENIRRALDAELSFYAQVLGFPLPEDEGIEPVVVENL
jgi:hypothetical protein